ncbi:cytochrome c-type biogenesis protein [Lachnospiraceae bacterium G11]|nr:cytochrome c-type biogenesis protein [Lachnospiraceae bacterium G11]
MTITVFLEGILSFFSPCVLPLVPLYMGYLSGGTLKTNEDGSIEYDRKKVIINTLFFVVGIGMAFFLLGLGISAAGRFFKGNQLLFARIGGIIVVLFGLYQLGFMGESRILNKQIRLPIQFEKMTMSPITALIMGFVISFAWSPCIGPVLSSVLIMAATSGSGLSGFTLIGVYTLGYAIPFILVGFFTTTLLSFLKKHRNVLRYSVKVGGALLVVMGILMFTGKMNSITNYLSTATNVFDSEEVSSEVVSDSEEEIVADPEVVEEVAPDSEAAVDEADTPDPIPAPDFTLVDQYGETHSLSDYKGQIIFLNFWATWCPPCREELPYIEELYREYQEAGDDSVAFVGVTFPGLGSEKDVEGVKAFLTENGYTFPVLMNESADLAESYYITAFPTTFIIEADGNVLGYIPGGMTKDIMEDVIAQAKK